MARKNRKPGTQAEKLLSDRFEDRLQHDPRFLRRIERARVSLRAGEGIGLEHIETNHQVLQER